MIKSILTILVLVLSVTFIILLLSTFTNNSIRKEEISYIGSILSLQTLLLTVILFIGTSAVGLLLVEGLQTILFYFLFRKVRDKGFIYILIVPTVIMIGCFCLYYFISGSIIVFQIIFIGVLIKYGGVSFLILLDGGVKSFNNFDKGNIILYLISSKFIILCYSEIIIYQFNNLTIIFLLLFNSNIFISIIISIILMIFMGISVYLVRRKDLEGFLILSFCISHIMLIVCAFINVEVFCSCFIWDILLAIIYFLISYYKINIFKTLSLGKWGKLLLFFCMCQSLGVPPYPSFYLEVNFLSIIVISFNGSGMGLLPILGLIILQVSQFLVFCYQLSKFYYLNIGVVYSLKGYSFLWVSFYITLYLMMWVFMLIYIGG